MVVVIMRSGGAQLLVGWYNSAVRSSGALQRIAENREVRQERQHVSMRSNLHRLQEGQLPDCVVAGEPLPFQGHQIARQRVQSSVDCAVPTATSSPFGEWFAGQVA